MLQPRDEYIENFVADVYKHPDCYKLSVRADPREAAKRTIRGLDDSEIKQLIRDQKEEARELRKHGHA